MADNEQTTSPTDPVGGLEVFEQELVELSHRRGEAGRPDQDQDEGEIRDSLVGLALSGGSLRSAAMSLGLMQAIYRRGVLPLIDYMSTVSGGGYAGAYLSSSSLQIERRSQECEDANGDTVDCGENRYFPIAPSSTGRQPPRMLRFINNAPRMNSTWTFFNRYAMGLLLTWVCIFSGLLAAASLFTWVYRWIDLPNCRDWLYALGFRGDIKLAFFTSFVLFVLWCLCWGVSYFKFGGRATGAFARVFFLLLVLMTMVAIASLFGTGDLDDIGNVLAEFGIQVDPDALSKTLTVMQTVLFSVIGASLLPYLRPKSLLRSGLAAKGSFEKMTFWIATRALVFGVPFLFISFFARENISRWNDDRDDRITRNELKSFNQWSPMFRELSNPKPQPKITKFGYTQEVPEWNLGSIWGDAAETELNEARLDFEEYFRARAKHDVASLRSVEGSHIQDPERLEEQLESYGMPDSRWPTEEEKHGFAARWYHLAAYLGSRLVGPENPNNPVYVMAMQGRAAGQAKERISAALNRRLEEPDFYKTLVPAIQLDDPSAVDDAFELVKDHHPETLNAESWSAELKALREQLEKVNWDSLDHSANAPNEQIIVNHQKRRKILSLNRELLAAYYGDLIGDKETVYAFNVLLADQRTRLTWFWYSFAVFILAGVFVDMNATSWHGYYARRIARMWIEKVPGLGRRIPLAQLDTADVGRPYHLINTTATFLGRRENRDESTLRELFVFSKLYCGSDRTGYQRTAHYMHGEYMLDDAIAVSGGAVSPMFTSNPLILCLLLMFNIRMGQWVANPSARRYLPVALTRLLSRWPVTPLRVAPSFVQPAEQRGFCFVTDGGHYENLGLASLLRRRCRLIFALDGSQDDQYKFADLFNVARWAEAKFGMHLYLLEDGEEKRLDVQALIPRGLLNSKKPPSDDTISLVGEDRYSKTNHLLLKVEYPATDQRPTETGYIVYMKSAITGDEPFELLQYCQRNLEFPHDSSSNQFFDEDLFESYRHLGFYMGNCVLDELPTDISEQLPEMTTADFIEAVVGESYQPRAMESDSEIDRLIEELKCADSPAEREKAASELGKIESPGDGVVAALIEGLTDSDEFVVKICDLALRDHGETILDQSREIGLRHSSDRVQAAVAGVVGEMIPEIKSISLETVTALRDLLSKRPGVRKPAMAALQSYCIAFGDDPEHQECAASIRELLAQQTGSKRAAKSAGNGK